MKTIATLDRVSKIFANGVEAIQDFSLDLSEGERVSLLGPSGCGKSTILRILSDLETASSGKVAIDNGHDATISFVFQNPTLLPWKNVFDNVHAPLQLRGVSREDARGRIERILHQVELDEFQEAYPRELSGGMQMRVSIARALVTNPTLLLMDEPFAALDEITRFRLNDLLLERQHESAFSLLFVTHSVFESVYLCDRVAVMTPRPGKVHAIIDTSTGETRSENYRTSRAYIDLCRNVSDALRLASTPQIKREINARD